MTHEDEDDGGLGELLAHWPYGDPATWDCPHGFVYRVERQAGT